MPDKPQTAEQFQAARAANDAQTAEYNRVIAKGYELAPGIRLQDAHYAGVLADALERPETGVTMEAVTAWLQRLVLENRISDKTSFFAKYPELAEAES